MAEEEASAAGGAEGEGEKGQKKPAARKTELIIVLAVGLLVMIAAPLASYFVVKSAQPPAEKKPAEAAVKENAEIVLDMKPININIGQTKGTRFIRIEPHLVLSEARMTEELKTAMPMLIDRVILATSRKTIDELDSARGRETLKRDIMSEINAAVKGKMSGAVIDVYFGEYLIQ